jgi:8-amino-7-oxononanoate synthase
MAAAALEALRIMRAEPERVARLRSNALLFRDACRARGVDTGPSIGAAIVPVMIGSSLKAARAAQALFDRGVNVQPIVYPAVPERSARLRYFITACHTHQQLEQAAAATAEVLASGGRMETDATPGPMLRAVET